jgi:hypothetical protein
MVPRVTEPRAAAPISPILSAGRVLLNAAILLAPLFTRALAGLPR